MRNILLVAAAVVIGGAANAVVLHDNGHASPDGYFSDSLASNGSYFWSQTIADNFTISGASTVTSIEFWGGSEGFFFDDLTNFSNFEINIFSNINSAPIYTATVSTASLSPTLTGGSNTGGGFEYKFTHNMSQVLAAGTYFLNVGSVNVAPGDDGWVWSTGADDNTFKYNLFDGAGWIDQAATPGTAFRINGDAVPEPATMIALGAGLLALARRRRK